MPEMLLFSQQGWDEDGASEALAQVQNSRELKKIETNNILIIYF